MYHRQNAVLALATLVLAGWLPPPPPPAPRTAPHPPGPPRAPGPRAARPQPPGHAERLRRAGTPASAAGHAHASHSRRGAACPAPSARRCPTTPDRRPKLPVPMLAHGLRDLLDRHSLREAL